MGTQNDYSHRGTVYETANGERIVEWWRENDAFGLVTMTAADLESGRSFEMDRSFNFQTLREVTPNALAAEYEAKLPEEQRVRMKCHGCGAEGCKMWRDYQTFTDCTAILCGPCALKSQKEDGAIDGRGKRVDDLGCETDQIGWMVPAVPTHDGTFWGYTSVPADGVAWWRALPSYPAVHAVEEVAG